MFPEPEPEFVPGPLQAVHRSHAVVIERAIQGLLDERDPYRVSAGARAIRVLAEKEPAIATRFSRSLAAKLAGAKWLLDKRETGYAGIDRQLIRVRDQLRTQPLITAADLDDVLKVITPLGNLVGRAVQDALFKSTFGEKEFQAEIRAELRRQPPVRIT